MSEMERAAASPGSTELEDEKPAASTAQESEAVDAEAAMIATAEALAEAAEDDGELIGDAGDEAGELEDRRCALDAAQLPAVLEAVLLASDKPQSIDQLLMVLGEASGVDRAALRAGLDALEARCTDRSYFLKETASGYRLQVRQDFAPWILGMREEKPPRFSRAALETLALIAYRQPVTRGDVENVRGVAVSSNIIRMLEEREWIRVVGHKDVPGRPALYATTRQFLDYFNLKSLGDLPTLAEVRDLDLIASELDPDGGDEKTEVDLNAVMDLSAANDADAQGLVDADAAQADIDGEEAVSEAIDRQAEDDAEDAALDIDALDAVLARAEAALSGEMPDRDPVGSEAPAAAVGQELLEDTAVAESRD